MNGADVLIGAKRSDGLNPDYYPFSPPSKPGASSTDVERAKFSLDDCCDKGSSGDTYADLVFRKRILKLKSIYVELIHGKASFMVPILLQLRFRRLAC